MGTERVWKLTAATVMAGAMAVGGVIAGIGHGREAQAKLEHRVTKLEEQQQKTAEAVVRIDVRTERWEKVMDRMER